MTKSKQAKILAALIVVITTLIVIQNTGPKIKRYFELKHIERENTETINSIQETDIIEKETIASQQTEPLKKAYLEVPFICQAPLETEENWTYHEESCEEAALLQAYLYETGQTMTKEEANEEILSMIAWQEEKFSDHHDLYADEMRKFISGYYKLDESKIKIIKNASIQEIKNQISNGHPVIVPITGEILKNPYYPYPGYHMLTVIGYTEDKIITNDNGTRRGKDYSYDTEIFETAMRDTGGDIVILNL